MPDLTETTVVEVREEPKTTDTPTDTTNLKSALESERKLREAAEKEAKELRRFKQDQENAKRDADEAKAKEEGKYQELLTARDERIKQLEPLEAKAERYETALTAHLETQRKDLPKHILTLLDKLDPVDQLEYIAANRDQFTQQTTTVIPRNPKPTSGPSSRDDETARRAQANTIARNF